MVVGRYGNNGADAPKHVDLARKLVRDFATTLFPAKVAVIAQDQAVIPEPVTSSPVQVLFRILSLIYLHKMVLIVAMML